MQKLLHKIGALLFMLLYLEGNATIHRVNADPASTAPYSDVQMAIDAAATLNGDSIYIEGFHGTGIFGIGTVYPVVFLSKQLHLFGPGYFLEENAVYSDGYMLPEVTQLFISGAASGCSVHGLTITNLILQFANSVSVSKNKIGSIQMAGASGCSFTGNYIQPNAAGGVAISGFNNNLNFFSGNFIGSFGLSNNGDLLIDLSNFSSNFSNVFDHNTVIGGVVMLGFCNVNNNIFDQVQINLFDGCQFFNNIFWNGITLNPGDIVGVDNFFFVDLNFVFVPGPPVGDAQWQTLAASVATGNALDGTDIGMFGGSFSYTLSGLELPVISQSVAMLITYMNLPLCVTFDFSSPAGHFVSQGEYLLMSPGSTDPGPGFGTVFTIPPSVAGTQILSIPTLGLVAGFYRIAYRIKEFDGTWSHTREHVFEIQEDLPADALPNIASLEFFVGDDPTFNAGSQQPNLLDTPEVSFTFTIPLSTYSPGPHSLSFRALDATGNYGTTVSKSILVIEGDGSNDLPNLSNLEFFTDGDEGFDANLPAGGADDTDVTYSFTAFFPTTGIHQLQVRSKDATGDWGTTQGKTVLIYPDEEFTPNLEKVELFIDNPDQGYDAVPIQFLLLPGTTAEQTVTIPLSGVPFGEHELSARTKDTSGNFGTTQRQLFFTLILPGDFTGDGCVNVSDLLVFMASYGCDSPPEDYCIGDLNSDPTVNVGDLLLFMSYYGTGFCSLDALMLSE